jgi:hypothetical protein
VTDRPKPRRCEYVTGDGRCPERYRLAPLHDGRRPVWLCPRHAALVHRELKYGS